MATSICARMNVGWKKPENKSRLTTYLAPIIEKKIWVFLDFKTIHFHTLPTETLIRSK